MNIFKAALDTRHQNGVIGTVTQFDKAVLELQIVTDGQVSDAWEEPQFELIAMKRDANAVREVDQDRFTILSKEEHRVQIELKEQFLTCRGTVKMQLVIKEGSRLSTTLFYLVIGQSLDHDIVESHRDVAVLDELEAYIKQGFDDLAYQEQRIVAVEQSTNDLNDTMNTNEAERNKAEITRQKTFDINEAHRTRTFNNQVEEQGAAFSDAQTQREKDFSKSQQEMSQVFESSQRERESAFNKAQELNQTTFTNNETKRQKAFNQSQTANQQDFVDNEAGRQRLFESNESSRQKSESQRVQNESERVLAETQRADAEVIRQQKMIEFEEKATQLSEDLDSQVARVDEFVTANEEKLLGPHDKTDYMGNAHKSVKDANDANVEYVLGEVNTVHYEGQHITATDTIEKQVRSAILKGNTLVNLVTHHNVNLSSASKIETGFKFNATTQDYDHKIEFPNIAKPNTYYTYIFTSDTAFEYQTGWDATNSSSWNQPSHRAVVGLNILRVKTEANVTKTSLLFRTTGNRVGNKDVYLTNFMLLEGDYTSVNITYFEGMQSVQMPVLKTQGKNLFNPNFLQEPKWSGVWSEKLNINDFNLKRGETYFFNTPHRVRWIKDNVVSVEKQFGVSKAITIPLDFDDVIFDVYIPDITQSVYEEKLKTAYIVQGSTSTIYEPYKSNILSVNEPIELRGIGDVKDTLDCLTGEVIENVVEVEVNSNTAIKGFKSTISSATNTSRYAVLIKSTFGVDVEVGYGLSNKIPYNDSDEDVLHFKIGALKDHCFIYVPKSELSTDNWDGFVEWAKNKNFKLLLKCSEKDIKTVDLNGQKVYSYDGTTHYSCSAAEGALIPTLSIDVPTNLSALVSRQRVTIESQKEQIITLEQENEQLIAQNEVQDIDISLNQDAINFMLFAPATMSVNDESKNSKGANTMAAYLANQILKGKLDYSLVVSRYGSYKEDIDTILIAEGKRS